MVTTRADGVTAKGCLQILGNCVLRTSIHDQKWTVMDASIRHDQYAKGCRQCFPVGLHAVDIQAEAAEPELEACMPEEAGSDESS